MGDCLIFIDYVQSVHAWGLQKYHLTFVQFNTIFIQNEIHVDNVLFLLFSTNLRTHWFYAWAWLFVSIPLSFTSFLSTNIFFIWLVNNALWFLVDCQRKRSTKAKDNCISLYICSFLKLFFIWNGIFFQNFIFSFVYFLQHLFLSFQQHLSRGEIQLNLTFLIHMLVNIFIKLIIEWALLEIKCWVKNWSVQIKEIFCFFVFEKNVAFALKFFLKKSVGKWQFIDFLPFIYTICDIFGPFIDVKLLNFEFSWFDAIRVRTYLLLFRLFRLFTFCHYSLRFFFTIGSKRIKLSQFYLWQYLNEIRLFNKGQRYQILGC